jgi:hypothetical protein
MFKPFLAALACCLLVLLPAARAQAANACDLNQDGVVDMIDVQLATNMALGLAPCNANIAGSGVCNTVVVQRVINAVLSGTCITGTPHSVTLTWTASTSPNVIGYNVYRGSTSNGPYTKVNSLPVAGTTHTDYAVQAGQTYYYMATAVDDGGNESAYSNQAKAVIPSP